MTTSSLVKVKKDQHGEIDMNVNRVLCVLLEDLLDGNADLSVVAGRVDGSVRAFAEQHTLSLLIQLILILNTTTAAATQTSRHANPHKSNVVAENVSQEFSLEIISFVGMGRSQTIVVVLVAAAAAHAYMNMTSCNGEQYKKEPRIYVLVPVDDKFRQFVPLLTNRDISLIRRGRLYSICVQSSMLQIRLRPYGHVLRKEVTDWVKKCMEYEVEGSRLRGRPKRTRKEVVRKDCQARIINLNKEDAMDRGRWKKLIKIG